MAACPGLRQVPFLPCRYGQSRPCVMPARSSPFSRAILPPSGMCHPYIRALPNVTRPLCAPDTFLLLSRSASAKGGSAPARLGGTRRGRKKRLPGAWPDRLAGHAAAQKTPGLAGTGGGTVRPMAPVAPRTLPSGMPRILEKEKIYTKTAR